MELAGEILSLLRQHSCLRHNPKIVRESPRWPKIAQNFRKLFYEHLVRNSTLALLLHVSLFLYFKLCNPLLEHCSTIKVLLFPISELQVKQEKFEL